MTEILEPATETSIELRCRECGYGVSSRRRPDFCPMCRSTDWKRVDSRPLRLSAVPVSRTVTAR